MNNKKCSLLFGRASVIQKTTAAKKILNTMVIIIVAFIILIFLTSCNNSENNTRTSIATQRQITKTTPDNAERKPSLAHSQEQSGGAVTDSPQTNEKPDEMPMLTKKEAFIKSLIENMTLNDKIGQMLILSFETDVNNLPLLNINEAVIDELSKHKPGGIIYFASNINTPEQTLSLSNDLNSNSIIPLFICVDEEGGRVTRITKSHKMEIKNTPAAKNIGNTNNPENAYTIYKSIAGNLKKLGINTCFSPVCDLNSDNKGVIGDRAFSGIPEIAGAFSARAIDAFNDSGIISSLKHFPGHGAAIGDTHASAITSDKSVSDLSDTHIVPFKIAAQSNPPMIMLSHIIVKEWLVPTSMSEEAVSYIRDTLSYDGIIITDSFRMAAITDNYDEKTAAINAVTAGVDIILMPKSAEKTIAAIVEAVQNGVIDISIINAAVERVLSVKYDYGLFDATDFYF